MQQSEFSSILYGQIYKLTNKLNGKPYVGQSTEEDINDRWKKYRLLQCQGQPKLFNALKKYGWDNFLAEVIDTTATSQPQLDDLEDMYILKFDCINNGYNCRRGGSHGKLSEETKRKISKANMGRIHSEETKRKLANISRGRRHTEESKKKMSDAVKGEKSCMFGKTRSEETKRKISNTQLGKKRKPFTEEQRKRISDAVKNSWAQRAAASLPNLLIP